MNTFLFFISSIYFFGLTNAKLSIGSNNLNPLDRDLHQRVLDPDECQRQLQYVRENNTLLLAEFLDAGLRIPRGILQGNLNDYGNYHQCLDIHQSVQNMEINGKFCWIRIPVNQNVQSTNTQRTFLSFDPSFLRLPLNTIKKLEERNSLIDEMKAIFGNEMGPPRMDPDNPLLNIAFRLALCIPKVCTTKEALSSSVMNITDLGFQYEDIYCRLPNDKPWAPVDYVAIVFFSLIGFLTLLSTSYDVYYNVVAKKDPKNINTILSVFSAYTNCQRLLIIKSNPNAIECLDGIRSLATFWVVVGHSFLAFISFSGNILNVLSWYSSYNAIIIRTANLSVDTFFCLSGLLLVYTTSNKLTGCQLIRNLPVFYLNRILRMFPVLAALILFEASLYNRLGDGPMWDTIFSSVERCRTLWWTTLLHLQNFLNPQEACLSVTWYLAIDVQLHILSPLVLFWVLEREKRTAWCALSLVLLISLIASSAFIFSNEFSDEGLIYYVYVYVNILTRAPPFFVGMIYGYALHLGRGKKSKLPNTISYCLTTLSILLLGLIMYCMFTGDQADFKYQAIKDLYDSFLRPFWALGLGWIIYVCHTGSGGPINWLLTLNMWKIPSRISYSIYLTHFSLMYVVYSNTLQPLYFTVERMMFGTMAYILITLIISFFLTVLIDSPFAILCRLLLGLASKKPGKKAESNESVNNVTLVSNENVTRQSSTNDSLPVFQPKCQDEDFKQNSIDNSGKHKHTI